MLRTVKQRGPNDALQPPADLCSAHTQRPHCPSAPSPPPPLIAPQPHLRARSERSGPQLLQSPEKKKKKKKKKKKRRKSAPRGEKGAGGERGEEAEV